MTQRFGWCLDGIHSQCPVYRDINGGQLVCSCDCHRRMETAETIGDVL